MVLHFGEMSRWRKPLSLKDCLDVPEALQPYVSDYKLNVFDIAFLDEEKVKKFKGDFGVVAEYFLQKRKNHSYKPSSNVLKHVKEITEMLAALTGDVRYAELYEPEMEEREVSMCEILDAAINKGMERGMALGRSEGMALGRSEGMALEKTNFMNLIRYLVASNREDEIKILAEDEEYLEQLRKEMEEN